MKRSRLIALVAGSFVVLAAACAPPPPPAPTPATLAVAYTDRDAVRGFDPLAGDVLIASLLDANADGVPSVGDTLLLGRYPLDFAASGFGQFRSFTHTVTQMTIDCCSQALYGQIDGGPSQPGGAVFDFIAENASPSSPGLQESFSLCDSASRCVGAADSGYYSYQLVVADPGAPGDPDTAVPQVQVDPRTGVGVGDEPFVDAAFLWR